MKTGFGLRVWLLVVPFLPVMSVMGDTNVTCTFDPWPGYSVRGNHQEDGFSFQHPYLWWESNATPGDPTGGMLRRQAVLPRAVRHWTLTTLREKLIKIGAKVVRHAGG